MIHLFPSSARARRVRNALLASVFSLGLVGTGAFVARDHTAFADPVHVDAPAPTDFTAVVAQVAPAVVSVRVKTETASSTARRSTDFDNLPPGLQDFFRRFQVPGGPGDNGSGNGNNNGQPFHPREGMSQGSGFFISDDGYLVTNAHVVEDGKSFQVVTDDGRELDAKLSVSTSGPTSRCSRSTAPASNI